jgi:hypothetical protein
MTEIEEVSADITDFAKDCLTILDKFKADQAKWLESFKAKLVDTVSTASGLFTETLVKSMEYVEKIAKAFELVKEDKRQVAIWLAGQIIGDSGVEEAVAAEVYKLLETVAESFVDNLIAASKGIYTFAKKRLFCCC